MPNTDPSPAKRSNNNKQQQLPAHSQQQQQQRTTRIYWSALLIVRSRGQRRKGQSRLSCARAEERPGRMRHGRWGRAHGWASVPPTASQTIAASSVDAAWGSGHHHEAHMRGTGGVPPQHATSCHAVACRPGRRRTTCACHTRDQTHTHQWGEGAGWGVGGMGERTCSEPRRPPAHGQIESLLPKEPMGLRSVNSRRRWCTADGALTRGHWATAANSGDAHPHTHHTPHRTRTH